MHITKFLTPQVRTFIYGSVAALLSVATVQGWVTDDLAKSIQDNLPTIVGAVSSIIAAANVKQKPEVVAPAVPVAVLDKPVSIGVAHTAVVEEPIS